jgi:hypothetical protein
MTLSAQAVWYGLRAQAALSRLGVSGTATVGQSGAQKMEFSAADVGYAWKAVATGVGDEVKLDLNTGQVTALVGAPTITDEGIDYQGATLPVAAKIYALLLVCGSANTGNQVVTSTVSGVPKGTMRPGQFLQGGIPAGVTVVGGGGDTLVITMGQIGDQVTVYVLGAD